MTKEQRQATREALARAAILKINEISPAQWDQIDEADYQYLIGVFKDIEAATLEEALNEGAVWSFMRQVLSQGKDIYIDYSNGKYKCYEEYSARLDAAARERAEQFIKQAQERRA